jgi:hypothetical protein
MVCEDETHKHKISLEELLIPFISNFPINPFRFGPIKFIFIFGIWALDFNETSLIIPKLILEPLNSIVRSYRPVGIVDTEESLDKIIKLIIDWNINKIFDKTECNSQSFLNLVLNKLDIKIEEFEFGITSFILFLFIR